MENYVCKIGEQWNTIIYQMINLKKYNHAMHRECIFYIVQSASISFESFIYEIYDLGNKTLNHISHEKDVYIVSRGILPENWEVVLASFKYKIKISYLSCLYT